MITATVSISRNFGQVLDDMDRRKLRLLRIKTVESLEYLKNKIASYAPVRTGELRSLISSLPTSSAKVRGFSVMYGRGSVEISVLLARRKDRKIRWVNDGTGIYGPKGSYIYPRKAKFLSFRTENGFFRLRRIKGQRGQKFIERGIAASRVIIKSKIMSALKG